MATQNINETTPQSATQADANPSIKPKKWLLLAVASVVLLAAFFMFNIPKVKLDEKPIDLKHADVWVHSQNFSLLPHDLLQVPLLKSLLTEDLLYFYAQDEDWLSLQGAMRRISFEHDLNWSDALLKKVAEAPADVYMWHDDSHALRYWALSVERNQFAVIAQKLATLKFTMDRQVHEIARINVDGDEVPILSLKLSAHRNMLLAVHDKRLVLLSAVRMASGPGGNLSHNGELLIKNLLSKDQAKRAQVVFEWQADDKAVLKQDSQQTIFLSSRFFAQGYGAFVPSTRALRFDYDGQQWRTHAQLTAADYDAKIWTYMPANAAFCASSPIDWAQAQKAINGAEALVAKPSLEAEFASTAAICWYAGKDNDITQPLVAVLRKSNTQSSEALSALFDWGVATNQEHLRELVKIYRARRQVRDQLFLTKLELETLNKTVISKELKKETQEKRKRSLEQQKETTKATIANIEQELEAFKSQIEQAKQASQAQANLAHENKVSQDGTFTVLARKLSIGGRSNSSPQLAMNDEVVYFSSNVALLDAALAVGGKRLPNLQESSQVLAAKAQQFLYVNPSLLADIIHKVGHEALLQTSKEHLRAAFDYHMPQRLDALREHAPFSLVLDSPLAADGFQQNQAEWKPLAWQTQSAK